MWKCAALRKYLSHRCFFTSGIYVADTGKNCDEFCTSVDLSCSPNLIDYFKNGTVTPEITNRNKPCILDDTNDKFWIQPYHPIYIEQSNRCHGYVNIDMKDWCKVDRLPADVRRLCACVSQGNLCEHLGCLITRENVCVFDTMSSC